MKPVHRATLGKRGSWNPRPLTESGGSLAELSQGGSGTSCSSQRLSRKLGGWPFPMVPPSQTYPHPTRTTPAGALLGHFLYALWPHHLESGICSSRTELPLYTPCDALNSGCADP